MPEELAQVKVLRFDPTVDKVPRYETYQTPYEGIPVLQVLRYIFENFDPTFSFRYGCSGPDEVRCGACAILVNDKPVLSCQKLAEKEMVIEPHPKFEIIKDLVIDLRQKREKIAKREAWVKITVDPKKCDGCRDCMRICVNGVWEVKKAEGKATAVPVDGGSCCGLTCRQCILFCHARAITMVEK